MLRFIGRWLLWLVVLVILVPAILVGALNWVDPPTSMFMVLHNIKAGADGQKASHHWMPMDRISPQMALAVIASEDQRFPVHFGIDFTELGKAVRSGDKSPRGASTITQQTAKNLFLWPGRSYLRKVIEAGLAIYLELFLSKQRILEIYLNIAQTGPYQFGVETAAQDYFNKAAAQLNRHDASRIAAILPNPREYSATQRSEYIVGRQQWILLQMRLLGGTDYLIHLR